MSQANDKAPVGVYDSGVGGLSILRALQDRLPNEQFIYVADSGHAPYGERHRDFVESRVLAIGNFMMSHGVKGMVLACNTASVLAAGKLRSLVPFPVVAMEPAIKPAVAMTKSNVILVMGTTATVNSEAVRKLCSRFGEGKQIILQACPGLVELVEHGELNSDRVTNLLRRYLMPALAAGADTIVLGCTHYSVLTAAIRTVVGVGSFIIDPAGAVAEHLVRLIEPALVGAVQQESEPNYFTSGPVSELESFIVSWSGSVGKVSALPESLELAPV